MSIASSLTQTGAKLSAAIGSCKSAVTAKGVSVPSGAALSDLPGYIAQIPSGGASVSVTFHNTYQSVTATVYLGDGTAKTIAIPTGDSTHVMTQNGCFLFSPPIEGGGYWSSGWSGGMLSGSGGGSVVIYDMTIEASGEDTYYSAVYYGAAVTGGTAAFEITAFSQA